MPASCKVVKAKSCLQRNIFNDQDLEKLSQKVLMALVMAHLIIVYT